MNATSRTLEPILTTSRDATPSGTTVTTPPRRQRRWWRQPPRRHSSTGGPLDTTASMADDNGHPQLIRTIKFLAAVLRWHLSLPATPGDAELKTWSRAMAERFRGIVNSSSPIDQTHRPSFPEPKNRGTRGRFTSPNARCHFGPYTSLGPRAGRLATPPNVMLRPAFCAALETRQRPRNAGTRRAALLRG